MQKDLKIMSVSRSVNVIKLQVSVVTVCCYGLNLVSLNLKPLDLVSVTCFSAWVLGGEDVLALRLLTRMTIMGSDVAGRP